MVITNYMSNFTQQKKEKQPVAASVDDKPQLTYN